MLLAFAAGIAVAFASGAVADAGTPTARATSPKTNLAVGETAEMNVTVTGDHSGSVDGATFSWGDGVTTPPDGVGAHSASTTFDGSHPYGAAGTFHAVFKWTNGDGEVATAAIDYTVTAAATTTSTSTSTTVPSSTTTTTQAPATTSTAVVSPTSTNMGVSPTTLQAAVLASQIPSTGNASRKTLIVGIGLVLVGYAAFRLGRRRLEGRHFLRS